MNVGYYVRTKYGKIGKIINISKNRVNTTTYLIEWCNCKAYYVSQVKEYKSSPNIIDLIQVGDYVNGKKVIDIFTDYIFDYSEEFKVIRFSETNILHDVKHIKSIVTKEQFEGCEYKL